MTHSDTGRPAPLGQRPGKRDRLVAAAVTLLHQRGVERTTLANIAEAADVPPGNVYYYFKTKDDVIGAVIDAHVQQARAMLAAIDRRHRAPKARLKALVKEFAQQSETIALYGCPFGSLCSELDKRADRADFAVADLMRLPIGWAEEQFKLLGRRDARDLAINLLATYEGSALLANTLSDPAILTRSVRQLEQWIDALLSAPAPVLRSRDRYRESCRAEGEAGVDLGGQVLARGGAGPGTGIPYVELGGLTGVPSPVPRLRVQGVVQRAERG
jgi:AcrR family transcriptional regulator